MFYHRGKPARLLISCSPVQQTLGWRSRLSFLAPTALPTFSAVLSKLKLDLLTCPKLGMAFCQWEVGEVSGAGRMMRPEAVS